MLEEQHRYAAERTFDLLPEAGARAAVPHHSDGQAASNGNGAHRPGAAEDRKPATVQRLRNIELKSSDGRITANITLSLTDDLFVDQQQTVEAKIDGLIDGSVPVVGETVLRALPPQPRPPVRRAPKKDSEPPSGWA
jgi:hypothetical protein